MGCITVFKLTNPFQYYLSLSVSYACVLSLYTPFPLVFFAFHRKNLVLLNLILRYTSDYCLKIKDIVKSKFLILANFSFSVTQIAAVSTQQVLVIHIHMNVLVYWSPRQLCAFVCVSCVLSNQSNNQKPHWVSDHSKLDTFWHKTHSYILLILRYQGSTCVDTNPQYL